MRNYTNLDRVIAGLRREYAWGKLERRDLAADPYGQFVKWFEAARRRRVRLLNVMTLATAAKNARPSARMVLLKGFDHRGFLFYTHGQSRKGRDIRENPRGEIVFYWPEMERQIRIAGRLALLSRRESARYFTQRPRRAQLAAWISHQSRPIASRAALEEKFRKIEKKFHGRTVPLPPHWGGCRLVPRSYEFWQGRENRLNDRFLFTRAGKKWTIQRLQP